MLGLMLGLGLTSGQGSSVPPSTLLNGLQSYWKLDEESGDRLDSTANNFDLTPNAVTAAAGKFGNAAVLSSAGGSYLVAAGPSVGTSSFTAAAWFRFSTINGTRYIVNKLQASNVGEFGLLLASNQPTLTIYKTGGSVSAVDSGHQVVVDTTYFICGTYDVDAGEAKIRLNAHAAVSQSVVGVPSITAAPLYVGAANTTTGRIDGWVDEVGIWNRVLTDNEIAELYNSGTGVTYPF